MLGLDKGNKKCCKKGVEGGQKKERTAVKTSRDYEVSLVDGGGREKSDATPQPLNSA